MKSAISKHNSLVWNSTQREIISKRLLGRMDGAGECYRAPSKLRTSLSKHDEKYIFVGQFHGSVRLKLRQLERGVNEIRDSSGSSITFENNFSPQASFVPCRA